MAATIKIKNSSTAGAAPTASDLVQGELAVNVTDKRLYTENSGGTIVELGTNPSVPVTFPDGSASAPSLTNSGDTNTGMFFPAADTIAFAEGGTEAMRLDSSGNMGLGVTPSAWRTAGGEKAIQIGTALTAYSNSGGDVYWNKNWFINSSSQSIYLNNGFAQSYGMVSGEHRWYVSPSGTAGNAITFTQAMTLDASGNLIIGGTTAYGKTTVSGALPFLRVVDTAGSSGVWGSYISGASTDLAAFTYSSVTGENRIGGLQSYVFPTFYSGGSERARIDTSGYFKQSNNGSYRGISAATNEFNSNSTSADVLQVTANSSSFAVNVLAVCAARNTTNNSFYAYTYYNDGAAAHKFRVADSGNVTNTNNSYGATSDIKLKENITDATPKLAQLKQVRVVNYNFIGSEEKQLGVIAQELEQIFPSMVEETSDIDRDGNNLGTTTKAVKYSVFVPMLIKAMQEQQAIIETLTNRITALEQA